MSKNEKDSLVINQNDSSRELLHPNYLARLQHVLEKIGPFPSAGIFRRRWTIIVLIFILWNAITIPLRFGFEDLWNRNQSVFYVFDYIGDIVFLVDIFINFRTTFLSHGIVVGSSKDIAIHYLSTWFVVDALASIPIDFASFNVWKHAVLRLPKLLRLFRVLDYFSTWELYTKRPHILLFLQLAGGICLLSHWIGCIYIVLSRYEKYSTSWTPDIEIVESGFGDYYLFAIMWAVRVVTGVGGKEESPETPLEMGYMLMIAFLVLFIVAALIGSVVDLVANMNASSEEFRKKMAHINQFMSNKNLPQDLRQRIRKYYLHLWSRQGGIDDESVMTELPPRLRTEINLEINGAIISKVPFFKDTNPGFISALVGYLKPEIYAPGDWIVKEGDIGHEMYFISQGIVDVVVNNNVVSTMGEGAFFGEISLLIEATRTASIRAKDYCDLFVLRKHDLDKVLKLFPDQRARIVQMAEIRITGDSLRKKIKEDSIFSTCSQAFISELCKRFTPKVIRVNEYFYHAGNHTDSMFFLGVGTVEIVNREDRVLNTFQTSAFQPGHFFGEMDFINDRDRTQSARAATNCTVCVLTSDDFDELIEQFPEEEEAIKHLASTKQVQMIANFSKSSKGKSVAKMMAIKLPKSSGEWMKMVEELKDDQGMKNMSKEDMILAVNTITDLQKKLLGKISGS